MTPDRWKTLSPSAQLEAWENLSSEEKKGLRAELVPEPSKFRALWVALTLGAVLLCAGAAYVYLNSLSWAPVDHRTREEIFNQAKAEAMARGRREELAFRISLLKPGEHTDPNYAVKLALAQLDLEEFDDSQGATPERLASIQRDYDHKREMVKVGGP